MGSCVQKNGQQRTRNHTTGKDGLQVIKSQSQTINHQRVISVSADQLQPAAALQENQQQIEQNDQLSQQLEKNCNQNEIQQLQIPFQDCDQLKQSGNLSPVMEESSDLSSKKIAMGTFRYSHTLKKEQINTLDSGQHNQRQNSSPDKLNNDQLQQIGEVDQQEEEKNSSAIANLMILDQKIYKKKNPDQQQSKNIDQLSQNEVISQNKKSQNSKQSQNIDLYKEQLSATLKSSTERAFFQLAKQNKFFTSPGLLRKKSKEVLIERRESDIDCVQGLKTTGKTNILDANGILKEWTNTKSWNNDKAMDMLKNLLKSTQKSEFSPQQTLSQYYLLESRRWSECLELTYKDTFKDTRFNEEQLTNHQNSTFSRLNLPDPSPVFEERAYHVSRTELHEQSKEQFDHPKQLIYRRAYKF